jgi:lipopolysaccharide export LptBFGC system permease protein LptF
MDRIEQRTALATASVVIALVAFFISPVAGFLLGILAVVIAASSRRSGGIVGVLGMGLGVVAIVVKVLHGAVKAIF